MKMEEKNDIALENDQIEEVAEEIVDTANELEEKIKEMEAKVKDAENKLVRNQAELQNFKRRKEEELTQHIKYAKEDLIKDLLPILDNFDRAFVLESSDKVMEGLKMVYQSFENILKNHGLEEIEALDKPLDPTMYHAIATDYVKGKEEDLVLEVLSKGYKLKDKVIRPAMVKTNKKHQKEKENDENE